MKANKTFPPLPNTIDGCQEQRDELRVELEQQIVTAAVARDNIERLRATRNELTITNPKTTLLEKDPEYELLQRSANETDAHLQEFADIFTQEAREEVEEIATKAKTLVGQRVVDAHKGYEKWIEFGIKANVHLLSVSQLKQRLLQARLKLLGEAINDHYKNRRSYAAAHAYAWQGAGR